MNEASFRLPNRYGGKPPGPQHPDALRGAMPPGFPGALCFVVNFVDKAQDKARDKDCEDNQTAAVRLLRKAHPRFNYPGAAGPVA